MSLTKARVDAQLSQLRAELRGVNLGALTGSLMVYKNYKDSPKGNVVFGHFHVQSGAHRDIVLSGGMKEIQAFICGLKVASDLGTLIE